MENRIIAANWKSNKTKVEAQKWLNELALKEFPKNLEIILFPPFTLLDYISGFVRVNDLPFKIGAQNVSQFDSGPYTGEISAKQLAEFASHVLIGHSERRSNFGETNKMVKEKIDRAKSAGLIPVVCVSELGQLEGIDNKTIVAYEPPSAISTSGPDAKAEDPEEVESFASKIKEQTGCKVIYGGSVDSENIKDYLSLKSISGFLVGGQSLEELSFMKIIENAS